ncbi:MAG: twin-arginine translocation signal domain-containing protein, partial [Anaerolineae bacterium]|nr:twin-arginine translocation signal domain-containing protein [Anaerolineae bacterium]
MSAIYDRRSFLKFAGTTAAAAVLAACAPAAPAEEPSEDPAEPAAPEAVELQWAMYQYEPWLIFLKE